MPEPIFMKLGMYNMTPEPISVAYFINPSQSQSYATIDGQSASLPWCQAPIWDTRSNFITVRELRDFDVGRPLTRGKVCHL
jgi:hypothetical protein